MADVQAVCVHDDGTEHPSDGTLPCPLLTKAGHEQWCGPGSHCVCDQPPPDPRLDAALARFTEATRGER